VFEGPRWYRRQLRRRGPVVALIPPGVLGLVAVVITRIFDSRLTGLGGLVGSLVAAPALLIVGAPFAGASSYLLAIAASVVIWMLLGWISAVRSTRNPMAQWSDYWREYLWMAGGVAAGVIAALVFTSLLIGDSLL